MDKNKILHIMIPQKFLPPFIDFVDEHIGREHQHYVFVTSEKYEYGLTSEQNVEFLYTNDDIFITLFEYMKKAEKIILHGLFRDKIDILLYHNPQLLKKCYWNIWGRDLYSPESKSKINHAVIRNMGFLITDVTGDYELAKKYYGAIGKHVKCFMYPSNLYKKCSIKLKNTNTINILIGNSADPVNNHVEILYKLLKYKDEDIKIFAPLSYDGKEYAKWIIQIGEELFGDKFIGITEFMPFEKYINFLETIDIAIFNHKEQKGCGTTITLLGMGKKVYLNKKSPLNTQLETDEIKVHNIKNIDLSKISNKVSLKNISIIKENYSKEKLINGLSFLIKA